MLLLHGECSDGKTCRALHRTDRGTVVIQGRAVTNREALQQFRLPLVSRRLIYPLSWSLKFSGHVERG
jgi:hypothetical protein